MCSLLGVFQAELMAVVLTSEQPHVFLQLDEASTPKIDFHINMLLREEA